MNEMIPRTHADVFLTVLEQIRDPLVRQHLNENVLPHLQRDRKWKTPLPEAQFQQEVALSLRDLPAFESLVRSGDFTQIWQASGGRQN